MSVGAASRRAADVWPIRLGSLDLADVIGVTSTAVVRFDWLTVTARHSSSHA